jgi:NADH-quinone oxidoreductase E subunit
MEINFNQEELNQINNIKSKYPNNESAIMPILWFAQKKFGYISDEVIIYLAGLINVSASKIEGVVSFYTMFHRQPVGKYHIQVCTNVSCMLRGGVKLYDYISDKYNIKNMETTKDGLFSLEEVECMGACGGAPMIAINEDYYENIDTEKLNNLLDILK